ncbi:MAG: Imm1 family immunity protein [Nostoc sp. DedQUE04]|uniref:Imm1 family immunity protein n=1 Tax=Nostoc sp. DedQUE04 TaxID=3075390 RepID=UPI002AD37A85|nr:Imm1 family immunity protein [Nostoc sp. DedQUE04]MDZ8139420.1 Imm1 family immunity protein [Nostoc sp. DedQUE04]
MFITKFSVEDWIGNQNKGSVEQAHSWKEIESAIRELDGHHKTLVTLETDSETHMAVSGGLGKYVVYLTFDNENFHYLVDPSKSDIDEFVIVGGQEGVYPASSCVDLNTTLKAAKAFVELGTMEESVIWEKDEVVERV